MADGEKQGPPPEGYGVQPGGAPPVIIQQPGQPLQGGLAPPPVAGNNPNWGQMNWIPAPVSIPIGCPPGLEYLTMVDQVIIKQQKEMLEILTGWETNNRYKISNSIGQQVFFAIEDTDTCTRQCCGPGRPFEMKILDNMQREVIHLSRPLRCRGFMCPCSLQEISIQSPPGNPIGKVDEKHTCWIPEWIVNDGAGQPIFEISAPNPCTWCCADIPFEIKSMTNGQKVGTITKQWMGCTLETFTDVATFSVTFPMDLDVKIKANIIGAVFLIDFMYFERNQ